MPLVSVFETKARLLCEVLSEKWTQNTFDFHFPTSVHILKHKKGFQIHLMPAINHAAAKYQQ